MKDQVKVAARNAVNLEVKTGRMPHPNTLPCVDCGHVWKKRGERRHEYDHHLGYSVEHQLSVEAVCSLCHARRDSPKKAQTHCHKGHRFIDENTIRRKNGTRHCRECRRAYDRGRRDASFWRAYRTKRRAA